MLFFKIGDDRALKPEQCVQAEKAENADKQPLHKSVYAVGEHRTVGIVRLGMRVVGNETGVCALMTSGAGLSQIIFVNRRNRIVRRQILMRRMTIGAGRGGFESERGRLPVESIAVTRRLALMARTAVVNHLQIEIARRKRRAQMRNSRMTGRAARSVFIALPESRKMTAGFEIRDNIGMTCRAHRLRVCAAQRRSRI